jgi:hypothetical protein
MAEREATTLQHAPPLTLIHHFIDQVRQRLDLLTPLPPLFGLNLLDLARGDIGRPSESAWHAQRCMVLSRGPGTSPANTAVVFQTRLAMQKSTPPSPGLP